MAIRSLRSLLSRVGMGLVVLFLLGFWLAPLLPRKAEVKPRKVVRFWHMWTAEWKVVVDRVVDRYNRSQDKYEVVALSVPSAGADSKFLLGVLGGDPPDVMAQWNPVIPGWADSGLITPLDDLLTPEERARFRREAYPIVRKIGLYKDRLYGITIGVNMFGVYYRPDQFREAGIDPKEALASLEALTAAGERLTRYDRSRNIKRLGWLPTGFPRFASLFGGGLYDAAAQKVTIDTPANLAALTYIAKERQRLGYDQVTRYNAGLDTASAAAGWPFIEGAYSTTMDGQWRVKQAGDYAPGLDYATAPIPPPKGGVADAGIANANFMVVPRGAKEPEGAMAFIKFWSGLDRPDRAAEFYTWGGWLPLSPAVANAPAYRRYVAEHPQFGTFVDLMASPTMTTLPPVTYQTFLSDEMTKTEDAVARGTTTPAAALKALQRTVEDELARRRSLGESVRGVE